MPARAGMTLRRMLEKHDLRRPAAISLGVVTLALPLADWGSMRAGDSTVPGGPLDEVAHLATAVIVLWAFGRKLPRRVWAAALVASVAIDIDHIPGRAGIDWLTVGTPRPDTHSLTTVALLLLLAWRLPRARLVLLGGALGITIHFFRDLAEPGGGISLLWPFSKSAFTIPHAAYLAVMVVPLAICVLTRAAGKGSRRRAGLAVPETEGA